MKRITPLMLFTFALTTALLFSCTNAIKISAYKATGINFDEYKTYAWVAPGDSTLNHRRNDKVYAGFIQHSADLELEKKGMKIDGQNPDVVFMFDSGIDERMEYSQSAPVANGYGGYGYGYGGYGYGYVGPGYYAVSISTAAPVYYGGQEVATPVDVGRLAYMMYDRKTAKLLWKGSASQQMDSNTDPEKSIKTATSYIFRKLPIKKSK